MKSVGFVVFGCLTIPKYRQQIEDACATWVQDALAADCIVRFYTGEIPADLDPKIANLCSNVDFGDSYFSATYKQWCGMDDILKCQAPTEFTFICGTDTFINVKNLLENLKIQKKGVPIVLGSGKLHGMVDGTLYSYFSGGAGIILNRLAMEIVVPKIHDFFQWWLEVAGNYTEYKDASGSTVSQMLLFACDCALCIVCEQNGIQKIELSETILYGGGTHTSPCIDFANMISCHNMLHDDFYDCYTRIHTMDTT